jgi:hypothetical protein
MFLTKRTWSSFRLIHVSCLRDDDSRSQNDPRIMTPFCSMKEEAEFAGKLLENLSFCLRDSQKKSSSSCSECHPAYVTPRTAAVILRLA